MDQPKRDMELMKMVGKLSIITKDGRRGEDRHVATSETLSASFMNEDQD